jgi:hypothetical protein
MRTKTALGVGVLATAAITLAPVASAAATSAGPGATGGSVLYVAAKGKGSACSRAKPCASIHQALAVARAGATILVAPGTYKESVSISKKIRLVATGRGVVIDAAGKLNGISLGLNLGGPKPAPVGNASGSVVAGFTVKNAIQEGIVAFGSHLSILNNVVTHNDLGATAPKPAGECAAEGQVPGDCGEGLHLAGVTSSLLANNSVTGNVGGMLVSDEFGPTAYNLIVHNSVVRNLPDCGITLAAHNPKALSSAGKRQPGLGGVYRNTILGNVVNNNGAAGVGFFASGPGTGSYENLATGNFISGNGIPGVAIHTHAPNSDANGNRVIGNFFSHNGIGEGGKAAPGDPETPVNATTNIDVVADHGATPISGTVIQRNVIANVTVGIWLVTNGHTQVNGNVFVNVKTKVKSQRQP